MIDKAESIYILTGRWLKHADKHKGGWNEFVPLCVECHRPMPIGTPIEYYADGYRHKQCPFAFDGDSESSSYTSEEYATL